MSDRGIELTRKELESIRAPIARALTLPARAFTSRTFFDIEVERIFGRRWMAVAFEGTLPEPGDMRPIELFGQPLALIRGDDGTLRAFHNICPYDGCLAVRGEQRGAREIEVYYHGWRYDLRGRLLAAPYWGGMPTGDPACLEGRGADLVEIRAECRLGLLFLDLGGQAGKLDDHLAPLYRLLEEYDLDRAVPVEDDDVLARAGRTVDANWKSYIENAAINILHEGFTHEAYRRSPDVPRVREGEKTFFTVRDGSLLAFGFRMSDVPNTYATGGNTPHLGRSGPPSRGYFVTLYPNIAMPIRVNMFRLGICLPEAPDRSRILQCGNFHPDAPASVDFAAYHRGLAERYERVYDEDRIAIEAVQRARASPVWQQHYYAPFWDELHYGLDNLVADDVSSTPAQVSVPGATSAVG